MPAHSWQSGFYLKAAAEGQRLYNENSASL